MKAIPYLNFDGDCAEAFRHYATVLGGTLDVLMTHGGSPMAAEIPAEQHERIMHAYLSLGDGFALMGSDTLAGQTPSDEGPSPTATWVSLHVESLEDAERVWEGLAEGGRVVMPLEKTFWSEGFGMAVDRFGTAWMVNVEHEPEA